MRLAAELYTEEESGSSRDASSKDLVKSDALEALGHVLSQVNLSPSSSHVKMFVKSWRVLAQH